MRAKKNLDSDVVRLKLRPKQKRIIQYFLEIECEPEFGRSPQQAKTLYKAVIQEVVLATENILFYDEYGKHQIPLWHKLFIAGQDYESRKKQLRYLLRCLGRFLKNCDNRKKI